MKIGYARVSTQDQSLDLQIDALKEVGCEKIFEEKVSGIKQQRPELEKMIGELRAGDTVVVYKLDRLGRSIKHLLELVDIFKNKGVNLTSVSDNLNTDTIQGKLIFNIFASISEFERDLIKERTMAGLVAAKKKGRVGGRPKGLSPKAERIATIAASLYKEATLSVNEIAKNIGVSKATLYKYLRYKGIQIS